MVSRYRRESASPLHLRDRNCTCTPIKLSKTFISLCLPSLICRSFRENGSHGEGVVVRVADAADRRLDAGLLQALSVTNREILASPVTVMNHAPGSGASPRGPDRAHPGPSQYASSGRRATR